jgi:hypothetical protein
MARVVINGPSFGNAERRGDFALVRHDRFPLSPQNHNDSRRNPVSLRTQTPRRARSRAG